jgi:hypothetical protein
VELPEATKQSAQCGRICDTIVAVRRGVVSIAFQQSTARPDGWVNGSRPDAWKKGLAAAATGRKLRGPVERAAAFRACIRPVDALNWRTRIKWEE